jgi:hypothetical protein
LGARLCHLFVAHVLAGLAELIHLTQPEIEAGIVESRFGEVVRFAAQVANVLWALFYLAEVKLALGKVTEAEMLFGQALQLGRSQWKANDFRFERLVKAIRRARADGT